MKIRAIIPWWAKFYLKIIFTHLPVYKFLALINLSKHGLMDSSSYAKGVFISHAGEGLADKTGKILLELGCGDSLASGIIGYYRGFNGAFLVDSGNYENASLEFYNSLIRELNSEFQQNEPSDFKSKDELFNKFKITYLTNGLQSLRGIPSSSVDLVFSHAVLEHVARDDFRPIMNEFWRILKQDGIMSHTVDFKDHLSSSLNNLRFSPWFWESGIIRKSLTYTNRLRPSEVLHIVESEGFSVTHLTRQKWEKLPLERRKFHKTFQRFSDEDLITNGITFKCTKSS